MVWGKKAQILLDLYPRSRRKHRLDKDTREMLKKLIRYDGIILVLVLAVSLIAFREYTIILTCALLLAFLNFLLNTAIIVLTMRAPGRALLIVVGTVARIGGTAVLAVLLCKVNFGNLLAFIIGYGLHYIAVIIYAMAKGRQKNKKEVVK